MTASAVGVMTVTIAGWRLDCPSLWLQGGRHAGTRPVCAMTPLTAGHRATRRRFRHTPPLWREYGGRANARSGGHVCVTCAQVSATSAVTLWTSIGSTSSREKSDRSTAHRRRGSEADRALAADHSPFRASNSRSIFPNALAVTRLTAVYCGPCRAQSERWRWRSWNCWRQLPLGPHVDRALRPSRHSTFSS